jgi:DNA-binding transcriptional regulator YiaG
MPVNRKYLVSATRQNAKLNPAKVRAIREQYSTGVTADELAKRFGVNRTTIMRVVRHKSWFNVE